MTTHTDICATGGENYLLKEKNFLLDPYRSQRPPTKLQYPSRGLLLIFNEYFICFMPSHGGPRLDMMDLASGRFNGNEILKHLKLNIVLTFHPAK